MRCPRFFYDGPLELKDELVLPVRTSHHLLNVLRAPIGARIILFNNHNVQYTAELISQVKKMACVVLLERVTALPEPSIGLHLGQVIAKSDHMDFALQKAVELGVSQITPLIAEFGRSLDKAAHREKKQQHWHAILVSAAEQSGRGRVPILNTPMSLADWFKTRAADSLTLICQPGAKQSFRDLPTVAHYRVTIGPEGGFSQSEFDQAQACGVLAVSLGPRILRTETAGIAALSLLQFLHGDL